MTNLHRSNPLGVKRASGLVRWADWQAAKARYEIPPTKRAAARWHMAKQGPKGAKDAEHLHNLRRSNPCKVPVPSMKAFPRGFKDYQHLRNQSASTPGRTITRLAHQPRGHKSDEHLKHIGMSDPCKQRCFVRRRQQRGLKDAKHLANLAASNPLNLSTLFLGRPPVPPKPRRGHWPLLSSRVYWVSKARRENSGFKLPSPEKLPRGYKDCHHLKAQRLSDPYRCPHPQMQRRPLKSAAHMQAQARSDPMRSKKRAAKKKKAPTIQSIIQSIIHKEDIKEATSPRSHSPRNTRAVHKALGITDEQEAAIKAQGSPRLRAKAVGVAVLNQRPITSCAKAISNSRYGSMLKQPRQGF